MVSPPGEKTPLLQGNQPQSATATQSTSSTKPATPSSQQTNTSTTQATSGNQSSANKDENEKKIDWRRLFVFVLPYVFPNSLRLRCYMALSFLCIVIGKFAQLIPPFALKWAIDSLSSKNPSIAGTVPYFAIAALYGGRVSNSLLSTLEQFAQSIVSTSQTRKYSVACFRHLQHLDVSYHVSRRTGAVMSLMGRGAGSINSFIDLLVYTLFPTLFEAVLVLSVFLHLKIPIIAFTTIISVALYIGYSKWATDKRIKYRRELNDVYEAVDNLEVDTLTNYETVKYFGNEEYASDQYDKLQGELQEKRLKMQNQFRFLNFFQGLISKTGTILSLLLAARACAHGDLTPGDFVLVSQFIGQLFGPLAFVASLYRMLVRSATDIEKSIDLFETQSKVQDKEGASMMTLLEQDLVAKKRGSLTFENVTFQYDTGDGRKGGVTDLSFSIGPGRMLGIVGSSGAGKSTLVRLIVRFYDPDKGRVLIDGEDIRNFTQNSLRSKFGVVAQDTSLFNRSLRYNIAYGKVNATDQQIFRAVEAAQLSDFVSKLPEGLDTLVGERGIKLSGGERQRVGVARCILKSPLFVLLDEASSSLDSETEREMQKAVQEIIRGRTTVAVAHRLSTVMGADHIIVMNNGAIVEQGTHAELLQANGKYKSMWVTQTEAKLA